MIVQRTPYGSWTEANRSPVTSKSPASSRTLTHGRGMLACLVHGLVTRLFAVDLPLAGRVAGVAFEPGGLAALFDRDVRELTNRVVPADEVFGPAVRSLARDVLAEPDETARQEAFVAHLAPCSSRRLTGSAWTRHTARSGGRSS